MVMSCARKDWQDASLTAEERASLLLKEMTLEDMARGGIFDHIGGGFSRYSTDEMWLVPHFEKMLYDNALLLIAYVKAYQHTKQECFADTAHRTARYILRELTSVEGGCYCGQDAVAQTCSTAVRNSSERVLRNIPFTPTVYRALPSTV